MKTVSKERILAYLLHAPDDVDIKQLVQWMAAHSGGSLKLDIKNKVNATWHLEDDI